MNKILFAGAAFLCLETMLCVSHSIAQESAGVGSAAQTSSSWWQGNYALGDWGGARSSLAKKGYIFESYYVSDIAGNPVGGRSHGFTYTHNIFLGISFDLDRICGWEGGHFTLSFVQRDGPSLANEHIGSIYQPQQIFGGQTFFLYQFLFDQHFLNDKVSFKFGRFGASDDFNTSPIYGLYMTNGINGNIRNVLFDTQFSAYPFATWAARLRVDPTPEFNAQIGIFQAWRRIFDSSHHGFEWAIHHDDGVFLIAQLGWTPEFFKQPVPDESAPDGKTAAPPKMKGLPGHYWVGGSYTPWPYPQFGTLERSKNSYGVYAHADQMVYQEKPGSDQGLTLWAATGLYPQEKVSIIPFQVNAGLVYKGLFPTREEDRAMLGVVYGRFSRAYAGSQIFLGNGDPRYEMVIEAGYRIQFTKFASIQPDIQYIINPRGTGRIPNALVLGAQIGITF